MKNFASASLQHFRDICGISHCSFHTQDMFAYLCTTLTNQGYEVRSDAAKNIYAKRGNPKICLQSHYDMVCVGDCASGKDIKLIEKDGFLYAENSSLGADNGIGMACMLAQEQQDIELLFTNDEEVGMIGANNLTLGIQSHLLLNLDSEDLHDIVLGCAGGVDIESTISLTPFYKDIKTLLKTHTYMYRITSRGFVGGHSGIDIHKNIENAIVEYGFFLSALNAYIITLNAGEKRNSIPTGVDSIIICDSPLPSSFATVCQAFFDITSIVADSVDSIESTYTHAYHKDAIIPLICAIHSGVYAQSPQGTLSSLNISLLQQKADTLTMIMMARANTKAYLERTIHRIQTLTAHLNPHATFRTNGYYSPWEVSIESTHPALALLVQSYKKHHITPHLAQIHAGLECGILKRQILKHSQLSHLDVISIGPTIDAPHSCNESLNLAHFATFCDILDDFLATYKPS